LLADNQPRKISPWLASHLAKWAPNILQLNIGRLQIARELALLREQGFNLAADECVTSFLIQRGFQQRLGARPRRDAVENICAVRSLTQCSRKRVFTAASLSVCRVRR
jgi:hypothetical protein